LDLKTKEYVIMTHDKKEPRPVKFKFAHLLKQ